MEPKPEPAPKSEDGEAPAPPASIGLPTTHGPVMDVVPPPPADEATKSEGVAAQPAKAEASPQTEQQLVDQPDHPVEQPQHKPPKPKTKGVGLAITATVIIVLALAGLATYAYLKDSGNL